MKTEIIPVIHMLTHKQVVQNIEICLSCGIEKVFLINHGLDSEQLLLTAYNVKFEYPDLWVGINMLGTTTELALSTDLTLDGLWCDATISPERAKAVRNFKGMFFGGLAFKYQPQPSDLQSACNDAKLATDVATTSGPGTGKPASLKKITELREMLGEHPMAIASGVSVENIEMYKGIVDYLLVASSITDNNEIIIESKLIELKSKLDE
jgi:hypothetical protein